MGFCHKQNISSPPEKYKKIYSIFRPAINIELKLVKRDNNLTIYAMIKNVYTTESMTKKNHIMFTHFEDREIKSSFSRKYISSILSVSVSQFSFISSRRK